MEAKRFIFEFNNIPNPQELDALLELAGKLNATIRQESVQEVQEEWQPLMLKISKRPVDLDLFAVQERELSPLIELFSKEDASAEELCRMLD